MSITKHFFSTTFITEEVIPKLMVKDPIKGALLTQMGLTPKQIYNTILFQCKRFGFHEGIKHGNGNPRLTVEGDLNKILKGLQYSEYDCFKRLGEIIELAATMYDDEDY